MPAEILQKGGVDPRHKGRDGFSGVLGPAIASPAHLELQFSGYRGVRTLGQDILYGVVVLLSIVVLGIGLVGCVVQGHMLFKDVTLMCGECP